MNVMNTKGLKWKGRTIFQRRSRKQYLSAPSIRSQNVGTIPLRNMFIAGHISSTIDKGRGVGTVTLIMKQFQFESNDEDYELMKLLQHKDRGNDGCNVVITMVEISFEVPRL